MTNYRTAIKKLDSRATNLQRGRAVTKLFRCLFAVGIVVAVIILLMYVSTGDYQIETHYVPTAEEIAMQDKMMLCGIIIAVVCGLLYAFCDRINNAIDRELARCYKARRNRIRKEAQRRAALADIEDELAPVLALIHQ